jgi:hypothetical protein
MDQPTHQPQYPPASTTLGREAVEKRLSPNIQITNNLQLVFTGYADVAR